MGAPAAPLRKLRIVDRAFNFALSGECKAFDDGSERIIEGLATTPSVDRSGDTINPLGVKFQLPLPLLWQHDPERPIGNVVAAQVTPQGIRFRAVIAAAGLLPVVDNRWAEIVAGLVGFMSIGFRALTPPKQTRTGYAYEATEWLELSCVTIPANPDCAITSIKAFSLDAGNDPAPTPAGEPAANSRRTGPAAMTIKEKIAARRARLNELRGQLTGLIDGELTAETAKDIEALNSDIEAEQSELDLLVRSEANAMATAQPAAAQQPTATTVTISTPTQRAPHVLSEGARQLDKERPKAQLLFRAFAAHIVGYAQNCAPEHAAAQLYGGDELLKGYLMYQKAAVDPAVTSVPAWAGNLVRETWAEFLDLLYPTSVYARLSAMGGRFSFGQAGKIILPARDASPDLAGDFIGENQPIPVKKAAISSLALTPKKMAVISAFSSEMATATGGAIQTYIQDFMIEDTAKAIDAKLLDNLPATTIRPAGLLNGVTPTASSGATLADVLADVKAAVGPILGVEGGARLVWLMNPMQALSLGLQTNAAGAFIFPNATQSFLGYSVIVSNNVPDGTLILVDAAQFASVANDTPQFRVSAEATLHMESVTPLPINAGTAASPVISLFQQDSLAVRMIQQMNWTMRRPGMVTAISGITW